MIFCNSSCIFPHRVLKCVASYILEVIELTPHFGHLLRHLHCCNDQAMTELLESRELTASQGHVLGFINHSPTPPCARDIEEAFRLSHPTVSGLLSRLEKKGFLEFRPDAHDRRCKRIYLLPKAIELNEALHRAIDENEARLVQGFTPQEQEQFRALLIRAIHNMDGNPERKRFHHKEEPK